MKSLKMLLGRALSVVFFMSFGLPVVAGQSIDIGDTTNPAIQGGIGNCPSSYIFKDLNGDGLEQNGECWRGMVVKDGKLAVGTPTPDPNFKITVKDGGLAPGHIAQFLSTASSTFVSLVNLSAPVGQQAWYLDSRNNGIFAIHEPSVADRLVIDRTGRVTIGQVGAVSGAALDVIGPIYQRGGILHADYVFKPNYKLESIDEHAEFMWGNKHLSAIPKGTKDENGQEVVEFGSHQRGIVEELEKSHIYIQQLSERLKKLEQKLAKFEELNK